MEGSDAANLMLPLKVRVHPTINVSRLKVYKGRVEPDGKPRKQQALLHVVVEDEHDKDQEQGDIEKALGFRDVFHNRRRNQQVRREYLVSFHG